MPCLLAWVTLVVAALPVPAAAGFSCSGVLSSAQQSGFEAMFTPKYSASLHHLGGAVAPENMAKRLSVAEAKRLAIPKPMLAASTKLTAQHAALLKSWLNTNANATVPGWVSTSVGLMVPQAWVGVAADVLLQLVNGAGDTGRLQVANVAGTVSEGGFVGVSEQISNASTGAQKFVWSYLYQAELNGKRVTIPLTTCMADVVLVK